MESLLRRRLLIGASAISTGIEPVFAKSKSCIPKVVAFDAFPIFDPRPIGNEVLKQFGSAGKGVLDLWRIKQFEYQWLSTLGQQYQDFMQCTSNALRYAVDHLKVNASNQQLVQILDLYKQLTVWPDVQEAISMIQKLDLKVCFLSNMTVEMLKSGLHKASLDDKFDSILSTELIRSHKPAMSAYQMALDYYKVDRSEIVFVAFAGWDAVGATWFGYPTYWVNRFGAKPEELGVLIQNQGKDLRDLVDFLSSIKTRA